MGGRFGKYGDHKRRVRLRMRQAPSVPMKSGPPPSPPAAPSGLPGRSSPFSVRPARGRDRDFIRPLGAEAFSRFGAYGQTVVDWLDAEEVSTLVACAGNRPVGFVMIAPKENLTGAAADLMAIAVRTEHRGRGVGGKLLREAEKLAARNGVQVMVLHTALDNHVARVFFTRQGYQELGEKPAYYPSGQAALTMIKRLKG